MCVSILSDNYSLTLILPRMRWATETPPDQTDLGLAWGLKRDQSKKSGITVCGLYSLIKTPSSVCMVRSGNYLRSGRSDQSPAQSLDSLIRAWSRVWITFWYGLESPNRAISRVCTTWSETFPEYGMSDQSQELQPKQQLVPRNNKI